MGLKAEEVEGFRKHIAMRAGSWPQFGDINYPIADALEAAADFLDMLSVQLSVLNDRVFGESLEDDPEA